MKEEQMSDSKENILKIGVDITMAENSGRARVESSDEEGVSKHLDEGNEDEQKEDEEAESNPEKKDSHKEEKSEEAKEKEGDEPVPEVSLNSFLAGKHTLKDAQREEAIEILSEMRRKYEEIAIAKKNHGEVFSTALIRDTARNFFNEKELLLSRLCYEDLLSKAKSDSSYKDLAVSYSEHLILEEVHTLLISDVKNEENYKKRYVSFSVDTFDNTLRESESILTPMVYLIRDIFSVGEDEELNRISKKMLGEISALKLYTEDVFLTFKF